MLYQIDPSNRPFKGFFQLFTFLLKVLEHTSCRDNKVEKHMRIYTNAAPSKHFVTEIINVLLFHCLEKE